jgi:hypothetical protein
LTRLRELNVGVRTARRAPWWRFWTR